MKSSNLTLVASSIALALTLALAPAAQAQQATAQTAQTTQAFEAGVGFDQLSQPYADWQLGYLQYERRLSSNNLVYARYQHTERFDLRDNEWLLGGYLQLSEKWQAQLEFATSPSHNVRPEYSANAWLNRQLDNGYVAGFGVHRSKWSSSTSQGYSGKIERYIGNWRWSYVARFDQLQSADGDGISHTASLSYYYDHAQNQELSSVTLAINSGEELEKVNARDVLVTDVTGLSLYGLHATSERWAWRWALNWQEQGDFYDRTGASIGVRYRF